MKQEEIIEMARQAFACTYCPLPVPEDRIVAFAKLVAAKYEQEIQDLKDEILNLMERQDD